MATYRCNACRGLYVDPGPDGMRYFHACPIPYDPDTGARVRRGDHRDENYQVRGVLADERTGGHAVPKGDPPIISEGAGRTQLSNDDLITGASPEALARLREE